MRVAQQVAESRSRDEEAVGLRASSATDDGEAGSEMTIVMQGAATAIHRVGAWGAGAAKHGWRNPTRAMVESMLLPGLGTIRNGELWKGVAILAGFLVSIPLTVVLLGFITLPAFWVLGLVHAYEGAREHNVAYSHSR